MSQYVFLLLILACPLMMVFMMRGMHGGAGGKERRAGTGSSLDDLRRRRDELDREIEEREAAEQTPVGSGQR